MVLAAPAAGSGLAPVERALAGLQRRRGAAATAGLAPGLLVPAGAPGWTAGSALFTGDFLDHLLAVAGQRWHASPHAAAALAWRSYTYWLVMPAVLGWATARRVPLLTPDDVQLRVTAASGQRFVTIGLRRLRLAVPAGDPLARAADARPTGDPELASGPDLTVLGSEQRLLGVLRSTLREDHLDPLLAQIRERVNLGERTLLGSLASAVAYAAVRGMDAPPGEVIATAGTLLATLGVADLVAIEPGRDGLFVQRRTCCLAFTLPEPKICSGCCLPAG
jgi:hypothetical protein